MKTYKTSKRDNVSETTKNIASFTDALTDARRIQVWIATFLVTSAIYHVPAKVMLGSTELPPGVSKLAMLLGVLTALVLTFSEAVYHWIGRGKNRLSLVALSLSIAVAFGIITVFKVPVLGTGVTTMVPAIFAFAGSLVLTINPYLFYSLAVDTHNAWD